MKKLSEMTAEELCSLPEAPNPLFSDKPQKLSGVGISGDDPAFWTDENGTNWTPIMTDDGWAKQRFYI